ncbi:TPA: 50S ribosomal protein L17 [Candidatus Uhrbacteria bacterium]|nr:50S ribosomal protein L17 [Candidatus Uhrbacteria bacterium]
MRHRKTTKTLGRPSAHRHAMLSSLAQSVILYEHVTTTKAKAKIVRPLIEQAIHASKSGSLAARRRLLALFPSELAVKKTMEVVGPRYQDRKGGYVRLVPIGPRKGDGADMVQIELV